MTPLTAFEYLSAHLASRMFVLLFTGLVLYAGCAVVFQFQCDGSYLDLTLFFSLGGACLISLGLVVAARTSSEELAEGLLNLASWPMMLLSEVWFSLEGASEWVRALSWIFPLTHVTEGMRKIMNEGAGLGELGLQVGILSFMTLGFLVIGSVFFKWNKS